MPDKIDTGNAVDDNNGAVVQLSIADCTQCPYYGTGRDPDPNDWFCDDDQFGYCTRVINDTCKPDSKYVSDRSPHKVLYRSCRPYEVKTVKIPEWCPMRSKKA